MSKSILKKIETKVKKPIEEVKAAALDPCECKFNNVVPFCVTVIAPTGFNIDLTPGYPSVCVASQTDNITCQNLKCAQTVPVPIQNPCGGADLICDGTVELNKLHYFGSIGLLFNVKVVSDNTMDPSTCSPVTGVSVSRFVTLPVDNDLCVSCVPYDCNAIIDKIQDIVVDDFKVGTSCEPSVDLIGHVTFKDTPCLPFNIYGSVVCQLTGQDPTGFQVYLLDNTMSLVEGRILTASGKFSFFYSNTNVHYIQILSPTATVITTVGPYNSLPFQNIGTNSVDCNTP